MNRQAQSTLLGHDHIRYGYVTPIIDIVTKPINEFSTKKLNLSYLHIFFFLILHFLLFTFCLQFEDVKHTLIKIKSRLVTFTQQGRCTTADVVTWGSKNTVQHSAQPRHKSQLEKIHNNGIFSQIMMATDLCLDPILKNPSSAFQMNGFPQKSFHSQIMFALRVVEFIRKHIFGVKWKFKGEIAKQKIHSISVT